ncbi:NAD-dependent epimerase/dehydratase family protein [Soonwooa sp.]|uniref:NAD-dependent epimerase/dehydratase family protein n=1 Tax=Soonwooa sp. TaxID=1938592 RepID=UPI00260AC309|nr:NAD-dependent epimerase/dehydratase family protein [Soonwooa sp.]
MTKIAILGASGFVGQNLSFFLSKIYDVNPVSLRNEDWKVLTKDSNVVINLVGKAHDHKGVATEVDYYFANLDLAKDVFTEFMRSDAKLFIHVSSLAATEEFESNIPLDESQKPNPQSFYGKSKRAAEEWLLDQDLLQCKKLIILRPPMIHGPGDKGNLGLLYKLISKGIPYPLASFDNRRSFISIDNFTFFIKEIIEKQNLIESGIYHISDDESISTKQIIEIIKKVENKNVINLSLPKSVVKALAKVGDVLPLPLNTKRLKKMTSNLLVSNKEIKSALGIEKLPLSSEEGLEITIKSFKAR